MNTPNTASPDTGTPDTDTLATNKLGATGAINRIGSLDFIRGIAVMGILWANIVAFGQPMTAYMYPDSFMVPDGDPGGILWLIQFILIDGKMRGLFTLLFGAGMYLFMEKAWAKGATRWLQARRLFWLMVFGAIHFYGIWRGDILMSYAFAGFIGLACLKWAARTQMVIGVLGYISGAVMLLAMMALPFFIVETPLGDAAPYSDMRGDMLSQKTVDLAESVADAAVVQNGSYAEFVTRNVTVHGAEPLFYFMLALMETVPLMLIGMAIYRQGWFGGEAQGGISQGVVPRGKLLKWGWTGVLLGSAITAIIGWLTVSNGLTYYGTLAAYFGFSPLPRLPVLLGLVALLVAYTPDIRSGLGERIAAAGRMAFSNYLGTSILMLFIFHGWALGLHGQLNRIELFGVVVITWAIMLLWSKPWLERFRYGPLEWLWRCLTYGKLFALRR